MHDDFNRPRPDGTGSPLRHIDRSGHEARYDDALNEGAQVRNVHGNAGTPNELDATALPPGGAPFLVGIADSYSTGRASLDGAGIDVGTAGKRVLDRLTALGRKRSTLMDYESTLRVHLVPFFGVTPLEEIDLEQVELFVSAKQGEGKAAKSIHNYLGFLNSIFSYGVRRGWCGSNPVALVDRPRARPNSDIRYLTLAELEAVLAATPDTLVGRIDRLVFLTAALTGMRRGEVVAVRWQDVDWHARLIRVRRTFSRGEFGTPKTRRSSRAVPLASRLAAELELHYQRTPYKHDLDLVFAHPRSGNVLDPSNLRKRFQSAARHAGVRPVRFHDLRHTFGTQMAAAGAPLRAIQEWLGHGDFRTTLIYADYALDPRQGARFAERAFGGRGSA